MGSSGGIVQLTSANSPAKHGYTFWTDDITDSAGNFSPTAAVIYLTKIMVPWTVTVSKVALQLVVTGTGATAISNAQTGIYSSAGVLISACAAADLAAGGATPIDEATLGVVLTTQVAVSGQSLTLQGSPTAFVWAALHIGVQASTAAQFRGWPSAGGLTAVITNSNLAAATANSATQTGHATNDLATIGNLTPSSNTLSIPQIWMALV